MARLTKRSRQAIRRVKKTYKKKSSYKKKTYKSSSKGYKPKSLRQMAKKLTSSHYLSYGASAIRKKYVNPTLTKTLKSQSFSCQNDVYGSVSAATAGVQSYKNICGVYTPYDIMKLTNTGATTMPNTKFYLRNAQLSITFTNQCNAPVFVDLYDMVARKSLNSDSEYVSPAAAWLYGADPTYYGATPFQEQEFVETFKVLKITRINMTAGETAEHRCSYNANQIFTDQEVDSGTLVKDQSAIGGLTHYVMIVTRGAPADTDDTTVGSSITKVDYIVQKQYTWQAVQNSVNTNNVLGALGTAATKIMELDGDEMTFITA